MFIVRKYDGIDVKISYDELRGEQISNGRFEVLLKDGSKGILMRKEELEVENERMVEILHEYLTPK